MGNLTIYGLALTLFIQLLETIHSSYKSGMEQNCLGVLSMAGCLSITFLKLFYVLKPFYIFHYEYFIPRCIQSCKKQKYKNKEKKEKRADCENKKGKAPCQKREINLKVCKLKCHSYKTHF